MKPSERMAEIMARDDKLTLAQAIRQYLDEEHEALTASYDRFMRAVEWVSCAETLPEKNTYVLIWVTYDALPSFARVRIAAHDGTHWYERNSLNPFSLSSVTHWMALPTEPMRGELGGEPLEPIAHPSERVIKFRGSVTDLATDVCAELTPMQGLELANEIIRFHLSAGERAIKFKKGV